MFKRYSLPGTSPATLLPDPEESGTPPKIFVTDYQPGGLVEQGVASIAEIPAEPTDGSIRWVELNGLGDIEALRALGERYDLHPLALEDTLHTGQRPKVEVYEDQIFIVVQMIYRDASERLCIEQVAMFLRKGILITIQEEPDSDVFDPVRLRLRDGRGKIRKSGADYLAYALLDAIIDHVFPVLEAIGDNIEVLEDAVTEEPNPVCLKRLHEMKRSLMMLRRFTWPERDVINSLLHDDTGLITKSTKVYLRDCYDHAIQIMDLIESYRDVTSGLMEIYLSVVGLRTNEVMRVLTVISAIFIPLTFVAGVYGMNFAPDANGERLPWNMPELYSPYGYVGCLVLMALIAFGQILFFKRKGWL